MDPSSDYPTSSCLKIFYTDGPREQHIARTVERVRSCQCMPSSNGRNLVVCIDGAANQFSTKNTNVVELYSRLVKSDEQLTYYNSGIGTYVKDSESWFSYEAWKQSIRYGIDQVFATNFKAKVLSAYEWLSENYMPGDRIFLFGFSRGAYQVRVIAGMIEKVGLLHKGIKEQIAFAYDLYIQNIGTKRDKKDSGDKLCEHFKKKLSRRSVRVHFVGAWDTVSAIGVFRGPNLPEMTTGMKHVCTFRHALALDELQVKLLPGDYIEAGSEENTPLLGDVKEVWFAGSHSDIGGGNVVNLETDQFGPSLRWMSYEAIKEGLKMECHQKPWKPLIPKPSMNWFYGLIKYILILKLSYKGLDDVIRWPRQSPRRILPGQLIHDSVFAEGLKKTGYEAAAVFRDEGTRWDEKSLKEKGIVEDDPYSHANKTLQSIKESNDKRVPVFDKDYGALASLSSSAIGALSITEVPDSSTILVEALKAECRRSSKAGDNKFRVATLAATLDVDESIPEPVYDSAVWSVLDKLYANEPHKWSKFKYRFGPTPEFLLTTQSTINTAQHFDHVSAICIGINKYHADSIPFIRGCVNDALCVSTFLTDSLGISDSQIVTLLNEMATRATIIQYISSLADNDQIKFNDPIIVFFSGIATSDGSNTACIAYDYPDAEPIPVSVINDLLAHVASVRGNNITLILDCCNAAGFKGDSYASANFSSHVLLASCQGLEVSDQGVFTSNLLRVLRERGPGSGGYTCTYRDIIQGLKLPGQRSLCQGKHNDRFIFSTKKPTVLHDVTPTESYLDGRDGRLFEALQDIRACRDQGNKLNISIIRDDSPLSCDVVKQLVEQDSDILRFVGRNNEHQLLVLMRNGKAVIEIRDRDEKLKRLLMVGTSDVSIIGCILEYASHFLWHLRRSPSLETNDFHVARDITLETWRLSSVDGSYTSASSPVGDNLNQDGIIRISVANTDESSLKLGFKLTNISKSGLFVWVFAFDILDLSIDTVYKPAFVNDSRDWGNACLPAGGHLKFSNVSSGEQLTVLPAGIETSVSYLKIFISNIFVDLSFIDKVSPLHVDGQLHDYSTFPSDSSDLHDAFTTSISGTLRLRGGVSKSWPRFRPFWDTIVVPIVKRREG